MSKEIISTDKVSKPARPHFQAVKLGNLLFIAGQVAIDPSTGRLLNGSMKVQTRRVLENIKSILEAANSALDKVVKVSVFLKDIKHFAAMSEAHSEYFGDNPPVRTTPEFKLVDKNILVEIDVIANVEQAL